MAAKRGSGSKSSTSRSGTKRSGSRSGSSRSASSRGSSTRSSSRSAPTTGLDKSIESFRDSLERSLTISRDRLQEVVDDAVSRGRMQRRDAEKMVSDLVSRSRRQTSSLLQELERVAEQARKDLRGRAAPGRQKGGQATPSAHPQVEGAAGRAGRVARDAADRPLAEADRLRRRSRLPSRFPITAYDQLTAAQVKTRLADLTPAELRKVRDYEKRNRNRKGVIKAIDQKLA
jgi:polyhydroxyalkanoate synthesis regulator phasin